MLKVIKQHKITNELRNICRYIIHLYVSINDTNSLLAQVLQQSFTRMIDNIPRLPTKVPAAIDESL